MSKKKTTPKKEAPKTPPTPKVKTTSTPPKPISKDTRNDELSDNCKNTTHT